MTQDPRPPILVATPLDAESDATVQTGLAWAAAANLPAILLHVIPNLWGTDPATDWALAAALPSPEELTERLHLQVERASRGVADWPAATTREVVCALANGSTHHAVAEEAVRRNARMIVVGAHAKVHDGFPSLGNTTDRLIRLADRPVLVTRGAGRSGPPRRVLCAVDLSPLSEETLAVTLDILAGLAGPPPDLDVVFVLGFFEGLHLRSTHHLDAKATAADIARAATNDLDALLARVVPQRDRRPKARVLEGDPKLALVDEVTTGSYDLLVVGTHGRSGFDRLLTGSVASSLLRRVTCDALVVPPRAARSAS
jgi:nucleotide-binding universal stress UspA family protein